jgi:hypothetical protein
MTGGGEEGEEEENNKLRTRRKTPDEMEIGRKKTDKKYSHHSTRYPHALCTTVQTGFIRGN